jgi:hypothetical protein
VGPRAGMDTEAREKKIFLLLPGIEPRLLGPPVRSQTLYWLSYPGPTLATNNRIIWIMISRMLPFGSESFVILPAVQECKG